MGKVLAAVAALGVTVFGTTAAWSQAAPTSLPPDVNPISRNRLPPINRADLDADGQRIYDKLARGNPTIAQIGPQSVTIYSPQMAEPYDDLNQVLRKTVVGRRYFEMCAIIAGRAFDSQFEWSAHEPQAEAAGVEKSVIDVIEFNRDPSGLSEKDRTVILMGRQLFNEHRLSADLWAKAVRLFGARGAVDIVSIMGDYVLAGLTMIAVDQQPGLNMPANPLPKLAPATHAGR